MADDYSANTSTTGLVAVGGSTTGRIETAGDGDWFRVALTAGQSYTISLNAAVSAGLSDPYLRLYNSAGTLIAYDDDSGSGLNSQLTYVPTTSGTFYLGSSSSTIFSTMTGSYSLSVTQSAVAPTVSSGFQIDVRYSGEPQYQSAFDAAAARWESIIIGDLPDVNNVRYGLIDDLLIQASVVPIDGKDGVLGRAGPTALRVNLGLPYLGMMQFDSADMASMLADGTLQGVILHEMGHVLGIGSLWAMDSLISPTNKYQYTGSHALTSWGTVSGNSNVAFVPLETGGGSGTAGSHWSEMILGSELMTGYVDANMPLSVVTIGTLEDLGYAVNYVPADPYFGI